MEIIAPQPLPEAVEDEVELVGGGV
jgi:hypothetical protein